MPYLGNGLSKFTTADDLTVSGDAEFNGNANFGDNDKAVFGAGNDLEIYHDPVNGNSVIHDTGTGNLRIRANDFQVTNVSASANLIFANDANGEVKLYHNGSEKLATASTGVDITGAFTATDQCTITSANNTSQLILKSTDADGSLGPKLDLVRDSSSPADGDNCGQINFFIDNDAGQSIQYGDIFVGATDVSDSTESAHMTFSTMKAGSRNSRMKLHSDETVFNEDSVDVDFRVESNGNANMLFVDAGNDRVGIGTGSPAFSNGTGLEVADATRACVRIEGNSGSQATEIYTDSTGGTIDARGSGAVLQFDIGGSERMRIDNTGRVSIHPDGTAFTGESSADNFNIYQTGANVGMTLRSDSDRAIGIYFADAASGDGLFNGFIQYNNSNELFDFAAQHSSAQIRLIAGGSERMRITSGGRVGIGQSSPAGRLDVNNNGATTETILILSDFGGTGAHTQISFNNTAGQVGTINTSGSGTTYNTTSDIRLKQDIEPLEATDKLMQMNPVSYAWKANPDGPRSMGFIAQEMQELMPDAVSTGDNDEAMMSMDYGRITPILVSALQDAHRKIEQLEQRIADMENN